MQERLWGVIRWDLQEGFRGHSLPSLVMWGFPRGSGLWSWGAPERVGWVSDSAPDRDLLPRRVASAKRNLASVVTATDLTRSSHVSGDMFDKRWQVTTH